MGGKEQDQEFFWWIAIESIINNVFMLGVRVSFLSNSLIYAIHPIDAKKGELLGVSKQVSGSIWDLSIPDLLQFLYAEACCKS